MVIEIDADSKKWIELKGKHLTVKTISVSSCCAPGVQEIVALPAKPKTLHQYHEFTVDNLLIYVQKNIGKKDKLTLKLSGFSILKTMSAKIS